MSKEKYVIGIAYKANEIDRQLVTCKKFVKKELFDNLLRNAIKADVGLKISLDIEQSLKEAGELTLKPNSRPFTDVFTEAVNHFYNLWNVVGMKVILGDVYFERRIEE